MRVAFILWAAGVYFGYSTYGLLWTIVGLIVFHVGVMRCLPYFLFNLEPLSFFDIFCHWIFNDLNMDGNDYCYLRCDLEPGFDMACYEEFIERCFTLPAINKQLKIYGPETFMLYYYAPQTPNREKQSRVEAHVRTEEEFNEFLQAHITVRAEDSSKYLHGIVFLPNYVNGPTLLLYGSHTRGDGYSWVSVLYEMCDDRDSYKNRHWVLEAIDRVKSVFYMFASVPYIDVTRHAPERMYGRPICSYLKHHLGVVAEANVDDLLAATRKHGHTINELVLATTTAATHIHHKQYSKALDAQEIVVVRDMRTYPLPFRKENDVALPHFTIPAAEPSLEHIRAVSTKVRPVRTNMCRISTMWSQGLAIAYLLSRWEAGFLMRALTIESLVSTNINGPKKPFYFVGHQVRDMVVYAGPMFQGLVTYSYNGKLRVVWKYDEGYGLEMMREYGRLFGQVWEQYIKLLHDTPALAPKASLSPPSTIK